MAHVARSGEVTTGTGRTAVRIGWLERDGRGWAARTGRGDRAPGWYRTQYEAVQWLYAWQAAAHDPLARWRLLHGPAAEAEGWSLFETGGGTHDPIEVERIDDPDDGREPLAGDEDAWRIVADGIRHSRPHCVEALAVLDADGCTREAAILRALVAGDPIPDVYADASSQVTKH